MTPHRKTADKKVDDGPKTVFAFSTGLSVRRPRTSGGTKSMKILIAAASFSSHISGLQRHAFNVVRCLLQRPEICAVHLAVAPWQRELAQAADLTSDARLVIHIAEINPSSLSRNLWYYRQLPALAASLHADVVHLSYPMPVNAASFPCPTVVTLHDLYPYEIPLNFGFPKFIFNRLILQQCLRNVDSIACVSEVTKVRLMEYAPVTTWRKAVRIYNCVEAEPLCAIESPIPGWHGEPFLLCVAQHRRNKNIPLLIRTFDRLLRFGQVDPGMKLVVIGIAGPETRGIHRLVSSRGLDQRVFFLEGLSEPELQWCYARCEALVAPSMTEGFGLPVAEGLLAGCRVICSDIPAHREVGDRHCRFITLRKNAEEALAKVIVETLREPMKGPISLPQFSASHLAKQYVGLYRRLVASAALLQNAEFSTSLQAAASERQPL
jgi:glycosyltransferase involved in cell wall biosynthesis